MCSTFLTIKMCVRHFKQAWIANCKVKSLKSKVDVQKDIVWTLTWFISGKLSLSLSLSLLLIMDSTKFFTFCRAAPPVDESRTKLCDVNSKSSSSLLLLCTPARVFLFSSSVTFPSLDVLLSLFSLVVISSRVSFATITSPPSVAVSYTHLTLPTIYSV